MRYLITFLSKEYMDNEPRYTWLGFKEQAIEHARRLSYAGYSMVELFDTCTGEKMEF